MNIVVSSCSCYCPGVIFPVQSLGRKLSHRPNDTLVNAFSYLSWYRLYVRSVLCLHLAVLRTLSCVACIPYCSWQCLVQRSAYSTLLIVTPVALHSPYSASSACTYVCMFVRACVRVCVVFHDFPSSFYSIS